MQYLGREFSEEEIGWIRDLVKQEPGISRWSLSIRFCKHFGWRKPDGGTKDMVCRQALLKMDRDGVIVLPPARPRPPGAGGGTRRTPAGEPCPEITIPAGELEIELVLADRHTRPLWNELIDRYHYLGYAPLAGAQLRYFVRCPEGNLALLSFSAAAWKTAPRDGYIGWSAPLRKKNLPLVVNNSRFLILPWVRCRNLASRVLGLAARRLPEDWEARYGYRPALLETFVEEERFRGTSYKAAGWICVGKTLGRGRQDRRHANAVPVKTIWLLPLEKNFRARLLEEPA